MYKSIACLTIFLLMIFAFAPSCTDEDEKYINDESELCLDNFSIEGVSFSYENDTILGHASTNMDLSNLIAEFSSNGDVFVNNIPQISGVTENDFSSPVVYTISYPQKGWEKKYTVIIEIDESALFVSSFSIGDIKFTITEDSIIGYCKPNIDVTNLAPTFVASGEMELNGTPQISDESVQDFSKPLTYTVYSSNRKLSKDYTVVLQTFTKIPQIFIYTGGAPIDSKETYVTATFAVNPNATIENVTRQKYNGKVRLRGNSTRGYPKPSFKIKFNDEVPLLGMHAYEEWCLIANYADKTLLRNWLAYEMAERLGMPFAPAHRFVEVYVNGKHKGCYLLTDQVEIGDTRVNIPKLKSTSADSDITGGYLLEADYPSNEDDPGTIRWESFGMPITLKSPKSPTAKQLDYISSFVKNADSLIWKGNTNGLKYFDFESTAQWFLTNELFKNCDASGYSSIFFYKDRDDDKIYMGPVWDFDIGAGNANHCTDCQNTSGWHVRYWPRITRLHDTGYNTWWKYTVQYWQAHKMVFREVIDMIDPLVEKYDLSIKENNKLWPNMQEPGFVVPGNTTYEMQIEHLKNFLNDRYNWLDGKFNSYDF